MYYMFDNFYGTGYLTWKLVAHVLSLSALSALDLNSNSADADTVLSSSFSVDAAFPLETR